MARWQPTPADPPVQVMAMAIVEPRHREWACAASSLLCVRAGQRDQIVAAAMSLLSRYPTPERMAVADEADLERSCRPLGFQRRRARQLVDISVAYGLFAEEVTVDPRRLPGVGEYVDEAIRLLARGEDFEPADRVLLAWHRIRDTIAPVGNHNQGGTKVSATIEGVKPRTLEPGQSIVGRTTEGDAFAGVVETNDKKGGRLRVDGAGTVKYSEIEFVALADQPGPEPTPQPGPQPPTTPPPAPEPTEPPAAARALTVRNVVTGRVTWSKGVEEALADAGVDPDSEATDEQKRRMEKAATDKPGLRGKALAVYVATGKNGKEQVADAAAKRRSAARQAAPRKANAYPDDVRDAVKMAKGLAGKGMAPGPKQHVPVRKELDGKTVTEATGFPSLGALKKFAEGKSGTLRDQTDQVRERMLALWTDSGKDPFSRGKHLAAIAWAYFEQQGAKS